MRSSLRHAWKAGVRIFRSSLVALKRGLGRLRVNAFEADRSSHTESMESLKGKYERLRRNYLFVMGPAYFLLSFFFLEAYRLAQRPEGGAWIPQWVLLALAAFCAAWSVVIGAYLLTMGTKRLSFVEGAVNWFEGISPAAFLGAFLLAWIQGLEVVSFV